jgi:hypothetical protein
VATVQHCLLYVAILTMIDGGFGLEILSVYIRVNKQVSIRVTVQNLQVISDEFSVYRMCA